eukprot:1157929-Pelagomonas_calceolata.AAC.8
MPVRAMADIVQQLRIGEEGEAEGEGLQEEQGGKDGAGRRHRLSGADGDGIRAGDGGQEGLDSERFSRTTHTSGVTLRCASAPGAKLEWLRYCGPVPGLVGETVCVLRTHLCKGVELKA